jgi:hypothetical protein
VKTGVASILENQPIKTSYSIYRVRVMVFKPLSQYFSYIVAVSFIGGGNRRKIQT